MLFVACPSTALKVFQGCVVRRSATSQTSVPAEEKLRCSMLQIRQGHAYRCCLQQRICLEVKSFFSSIELSRRIDHTAVAASSSSEAATAFMFSYYRCSRNLSFYYCCEYCSSIIIRSNGAVMTIFTVVVIFVMICSSCSNRSSSRRSSSSRRRSDSSRS